MAVGDNWFLAVDVKSSALNGIYGGIYHSPSSSDTEFIDSYEEWLRSVFADERRNVFVGDFNIRWNEPGCSRELKNVADAMGMRQIVLEPTRVGPTSSNIIDLVFTNMENAEARVVEELKVSDHETISIAIGNDTINLPEREESYVSWKRYSKDKLQEILRKNRSSNSRIDETIGEASRNFSTNLVSAVESLVDVRCCRRTETSDWYTDHLRAMKNERDDAYRQYRCTKSVPALEKYKLLRNAYVRGLKQAKNQSVEEEIRSCHGDSKKLWRCLKSLIQPGGKQHAEIVFGTGCSDAETARRLNNFFVDSVEEIHAKIPPPSVVPVAVQEEPEESLYEFQQVTMAKLKDTVRSLKDCAGVDNVTKRVPKSTRPEDHRPINMLPLYEKVIETIVKEQLTAFVDRVGVLVEEQSGFRRHHSCSFASLRNTWYSFEVAKQPSTSDKVQQRNIARYGGYNLFNQLPDEAKLTSNINEFKRHCKTFVLRRPLE
ncbi:uncharacterized protein LOC120416784 [Culex pipiens pallens]|uniref:uncharacterized protein LOC120416784 n=1 Tax=Culex pipiens pallens TaxID=42434 RepID=UPI001952EA3C|nr:uncharacterized protein LOC120416784 [Culex pipiens pallens]